MEEKCNYKGTLSNTIIVIGRNVRKRRLAKNMTQQELAYLADNMERKTVSSIERFNCNNITLKVLIKLCIVLETDLQTLMKEEKNNN